MKLNTATIPEIGATANPLHRIEIEPALPQAFKGLSGGSFTKRSVMTQLGLKVNLTVAHGFRRIPTHTTIQAPPPEATDARPPLHSFKGKPF